MIYKPSSKVQQIRKSLNHPVIDGDGHFIEYLPLVRDFVAEDFGKDIANRFEQMSKSSQLVRKVPVESRRTAGISRTAWWALPAQNTLDRATAMLPKLMYERLEQLGIDYALLYPTYGLTVTSLADTELRIAAARAFNKFAVQTFEGHRDRLEPVACIPMFTPEEALAELDYAVSELGLKAIMMAGVIPRQIESKENIPSARYLNGVGHDSDFDYDPVWQKCLDLGVVPTFHAGGQGWGTRMSRTNYVYNHIGSFAAAGEAAARSLLFGGVPVRFPKLKFAFQEGGAAWGANLHSDTIGHFEKRNITQISYYEPKSLDKKALLEFFSEYAPQDFLERIEQIDDALLMLSDPEENSASTDEFKESQISSAQDITDIFANQYFFGCEADDPMNAIAFNTSLHPGEIALKAIFASDIGHWDVPNMKDVLVEAYELVEDNHLTSEQFQAFVCDNVIDLLGAEFFENTAVQDYAAKSK